MSEISDTSSWMNFFTDAGIPPGEATNYAVTFTNNRIKQDMLLDLNKEYLRDMGITLMGDVIAILKNAKTVTGQMTRDKLLPNPSAAPKTSAPKTSAPKTAAPKTQRDSSSDDSVSKSSGESKHITSTKNGNAKKSSSLIELENKKSAASRILEHYVNKAQKEEERERANGKKRDLEDNDLDFPSKRSSIFNRLGDSIVSSTTNDGPKITVTMQGKMRSSAAFEIDRLQNISVFDRLAAKEVAPTPKEIPGTGLGYKGIFKLTSKEIQEKERLEAKKKAIFDVTSMRADTTTRTGIKSRLSSTSQSSFRSSSASAGIFSREFEAAFMTKESTEPSKRLKLNPSPVSLSSRFGQSSMVADYEEQSSKVHKRLTKSYDTEMEEVSPIRGRSLLISVENDHIVQNDKRKSPNIKLEEGPALPPHMAEKDRSLSPPRTKKKMMKKIIRINKRTGEIISEEKKELKTNVFSRLGN